MGKVTRHFFVDMDNNVQPGTTTRDEILDCIALITTPTSALQTIVLKDTIEKAPPGNLVQSHIRVMIEKAALTDQQVEDFYAKVKDCIDENPGVAVPTTPLPDQFSLAELDDAAGLATTATLVTGSQIRCDADAGGGPATLGILSQAAGYVDFSELPSAGTMLFRLTWDSAAALGNPDLVFNSGETITVKTRATGPAAVVCTFVSAFTILATTSSGNGSLADVFVDVDGNMYLAFHVVSGVVLVDNRLDYAAAVEAGAL